MAERVRIARDLHDLIGHHLTALSLNLEVASHVSEGKALAHVQKAQTLTKLLLSDVRETVGVMREDAVLNLSNALETLTRDIPNLKIHLTLPHDLRLDDPHRAQALLRCVQEVLTNTVKHAGAANLWLDVIRTEGGSSSALETTARRGERHRGSWAQRHERALRLLGGDVSLASTPGQGFSLRARLPV